MKISKTFEHNGVPHSVVCNYKPNKYSIEFDGVPCTDTKKITFLGSVNLSAMVEIDKETYVIRIVGKKIYIYDKRNTNIETNETKPMWQMEMVAWALIFMPLIPIYVFYRMIFGTDMLQQVFSKPVSICAFIPYTLILFLMVFWTMRTNESLFRNPENSQIKAYGLAIILFLVSLIICSIYTIMGALIITSF